MTCDSAQKRLSAYIDRQLLAGERSEIATHISECPDCEADLNTLRQVKQLLRSVPKLTLPASVRAAIEAETIHQTGWRDDLRLWLIPSLAVAAAAGWLIVHVHKNHGPVLTPQQLEARQTPPRHDQVAWHAEAPLSKDTQ